MESPLLTKNDDEHVTIDGNSSTNDEHSVNIVTNEDSSSTPYEAEDVTWRNPCTEVRVCGMIDFILALVQIVAAIAVLTRAKNEHPETAFLVWIIGYTCGCIVMLPVRLITIIFSRYHYDSEMILEYFFVGWAAVLFWIYVNSSSSLYDCTQHFWLCVAFLAFSIIRYVPAHPKCAMICLISVAILWISALVIGTTPNTIVYVVFLIVIVGILKVVQEVFDLHY